jgi:hypothetical protein
VPFCYLKSTWQFRIVKIQCWKEEIMVVIGGGEKLPAIKEKLPASIICFDLSSALSITKRHIS